MTAELLGLDLTLDPAEISNSASAHGAGLCGGDARRHLARGRFEAIKLLARTEGVFLDPVYTAKAFAALLDDVRSGALKEGDAVAFIHTGGTPLIFAYAEELSAD